MFSIVRHNTIRYLRKIELMKVFDDLIQIEKWGQVQRIELIDANDFIDTFVKSM